MPEHIYPVNFPLNNTAHEMISLTLPAEQLRNCDLCPMVGRIIKNRRLTKGICFLLRLHWLAGIPLPEASQSREINLPIIQTFDPDSSFAGINGNCLYRFNLYNKQ